MKNKVLKIFATLAVLVLLSIGGNVNAQFTKAGGGLALGTDEFPGLGITAKGLYEINEKIHISPSFTFFFPKTEGVVDFSGWEFAVDGHYVFMNEEFQVYGIAGLAFVGMKSKSNIEGLNLSASSSDLGIDLGVGAYKEFGNLGGFLEIKYQASGFEQLMLGAGVLFNL